MLLKNLYYIYMNRIIQILYRLIQEFATSVSVGIGPRIGVIAPDAKRLEQPFQLQKHVVLPPATDIRQHLPRLVINRMPQLARRGLLRHVGPHLIDFGFLDPLDDHVHLVRM